MDRLPGLGNRSRQLLSFDIVLLQVSQRRYSIYYPTARKDPRLIYFCMLSTLLKGFRDHSSDPAELDTTSSQVT